MREVIEKTVQGEIMQNKQTLQDKIAESQRFARKEQKEHNEAMITWKQDNGEKFQDCRDQLPDDDSAKVYQLSSSPVQSATVAQSTSAHAQNTAPTSTSTHQAYVAQCIGSRTRIERHKKVRYQQDRFKAVTIPTLSQLNTDDIVASVQECFREIGRRLAPLTNGCTATLVLVTPNDSGGKRAIFAWIGDSRAAVYQNGVVTQATWDHHPDHPQESARLRPIVTNFDNRPRPKRLLAIRYGINQQGIEAPIEVGLAVSRAFGNKDIVGLIDEPSINVIDMQDPDKILIASDGVWDKVGTADLESILAMPDKTWSEKTNIIRKLAFQRGEYDSQYNRNYIPDNITVMVCELNGVYLLCDGHGEADTCVDTVMGGGIPLELDTPLVIPSLLELLTEKINLKVARQTHRSARSLRNSIEYSFSFEESGFDAAHSQAATIPDDTLSIPGELETAVIDARAHDTANASTKSAIANDASEKWISKLSNIASSSNNRSQTSSAIATTSSRTTVTTAAVASANAVAVAATTADNDEDAETAEDDSDSPPTQRREKRTKFALESSSVSTRSRTNGQFSRPKEEQTQQTQPSQSTQSFINTSLAKSATKSQQSTISTSVMRRTVSFHNESALMSQQPTLHASNTRKRTLKGKVAATAVVTDALDNAEDNEQDKGLPVSDSDVTPARVNCQQKRN